MILKAIFANSVDPDQTAPDQGPHCLPVCKNRFEKFARIFSRRHKQTTFSDAGFLGVLRVKYLDRQAWANPVDPDKMLQNVVRRKSTLFASHPLIFGHKNR